MELFWKVIGAVLTTVVLGIHLSKQEKDMSILLALAVCCLGASAAVSFLGPVIELLRELETVVQPKSEILQIVLKCTGIAIVSELAAMICQDAGSGSVGKMVQLLGSAVILYLAIPIVSALLILLRDLLGGL